MKNGESQSLVPTQHGLVKRPAKWEERFILKRINEEDLELTLVERNAILQAMANKDRFVQVRKFTIMINAISGIDPKWGEENIPPMPGTHTYWDLNGDKTAYTEYSEDSAERDEWLQTFYPEKYEKMIADRAYQKEQAEKRRIEQEEEERIYNLPENVAKREEMARLMEEQKKELARKLEEEERKRNDPKEIAKRKKFLRDQAKQLAQLEQQTPA